VVAGAALNGFGAPRPGWLDALSTGLGRVALPMMLALVGVRLGQVRTDGWRRAWTASAARMAGGAACGWLLAQAFGLQGVERGVVVLTSAMPAAVNTYVLAEKFDSAPAFAAAVVTATTAASLAAIPLLAYLLR
jgi:malate permease and related proteins